MKDAIYMIFAVLLIAILWSPEKTGADLGGFVRGFCLTSGLCND
jgi:hypothetical protein